LALAILLINTQAGFAVYLNGRQVGSARSMEDVAAVVTGAEQQLKEILGREYPLDRAISVSPDLGSMAVDSEKLQDAILGGIDGIARLHVLQVNGHTVGAANQREIIDGILNDILREYTTDSSSSVVFTDTVTVTSGYVSSDITQDVSAIRALLEPSNTSSPARLTVENTELRQYTETVPFDVLSYNDATMVEGSSAIKTEGVCGEVLVTEKTVYINGIKQTSETVGALTTVPPVAEVVAVGTAPRPKTASFGTYIWPTDGVLTSGFGYRTGFGSHNHQGIDIGGAYGENIVAADGGEVLKAGWCSGYGNLVQIRHDNGDVTYYGHCSSIIVDVGDRVAQGQVIAHMGMTGVANGVHLHFEIRQDGTPVNPINLLP
jgi:murein DD-endopeptidase MepM/ murein hydrolase activator NlpD